MKVYRINGKYYKIPNTLNDFQFKMYIHLVNWKWTNLTKEPGFFRNTPYDSLLPDEFRKQYAPLYSPIIKKFLDHQQKFPFKSHRFLGHMASSQAACANLFLPILKDPIIATKILKNVKEDLKDIAVNYLDGGFRIEFWDEPDNSLSDHNDVSGTDADIAIAYHDFEENLNLWMIEHKLTEKEFTDCRGYRSKGRKPHHKCSPASEIIENKGLCYLHSGKGYNYWNITLGDKSPFLIDRIGEYDECPFKGGMNQLWRNQLLATSVESSNSPRWPYKKVYFSVVYHPENKYLENSIGKFKELIGNSDRFFTFTSDKLIDRAEEIEDKELSEWVSWYKELYYL
jgi:hypothetical protein